ncbi:MAG: hypothetical protein BA863_06695 [Desulfovibrio sp. S3730MH75]|nr:MAG: hypothetical protein BA863_06695 [Desulfovibrio sp. S3730MH75]
MTKSKNTPVIYLTKFIFAAILCGLFLFSLPSQANDNVTFAKSKYNLSLTTKEQQFIADHPILRLGVGVAFPPFQYVETQKDQPEFKGMVSDYLSLLEKRIGIKLEPVLGISFNTALQLGKNGEIDLFPCIADTPERRKYLNFTEPYLSYPLVIITREKTPFVGGINDLKGLKFATVKALATYSKMQNEYPDLNLQFHFAKNIGAVLEAVSLGKADACIANLAVASYLINKRGLHNLQVASPTPWGDNKLTMGTRKDWPELTSILQKGLDSISREEKNKISQHWISLKYDSVIGTSEVWKITIQISIVIAFIIGIILYWNRRLSAEIKEHIKTDKRLKKSEEQFRTIFEYSPVPILEKDMSGLLPIFKTLKEQGVTNFAAHFENHPADLRKCLECIRIVRLNKASVELYKAESKEYLRDNLAKIFTERTWSTFANHIVALAEGKKHHIEEIQAANLYGEQLTILSYLDVIDGYEDSLKKVLVTSVDITQKKKYEETIIQAEKMMSVGGLAAGMAHEINNPLAGILQGVQNIIRRLSPDYPANINAAEKAGVPLPHVLNYLESRRIIKTLNGISNSGERAAQIIRNMLTFSQPSKECPAYHDANLLLDKMLDVVSSDYNASKRYDFRNIEIVREYDPKARNTYCIQNELEQVVLNLFKNASQAMAEKSYSGESPKLSLRTTVLKGSVAIEIEDNGPGLDAAVRKRIFEPFFTTKQPGVGTGLGLSVSYFIITENHRGTLEVLSEPGKWTRFIITLPSKSHP